MPISYYIFVKEKFLSLTESYKEFSITREAEPGGE